MADLKTRDGVALYAEAHGTGLPVLLSCPLNTTCENRRPQVDALVGRGFRGVRWDFRGHGRSGAPDDPAACSMEQVVDDLGCVLDWASPAEPVIDELASIRIPALVVLGEHDAAYRRVAEVMQARLPLAESVIIPGAGHIVNVEAAEAFNAAVLRFLEGLRAGEA